jgi:integrase
MVDFSDVLFYTGMRSGELLALTPADILPTKRIDINKNYAKVKGEELLLILALDKEIGRVAEKTGLPPITVHGLRHSHASMLIEMGFSPLEIADRLGHESVKTTLDTYSHLYPDKDNELAGRLNQFRRKQE